MSKWLVLSDGYHGRSDMWTSLTPPALGVPPDEYVKPLPDQYTDDLLKEACAVIIEVIKLEDTDERKQWVKKLRKDCAENQVVFIADEVITGCRVEELSISKQWDLDPDIMVLGKAIANGFPLAVVGGKKEVMNCGEYFISSTFSSEALSLAACKATLQELTTKNMKDLVYYAKRFQQDLNGQLNKIDVNIEGYGTRGSLDTTTENAALFMQEACKAGLLFGKAYFYHFGHLEEGIEETTLNLVCDIVERIKLGGVALEGEAPHQPFVR